MDPSEYVMSCNDTIKRACVNDQSLLFERQRNAGALDGDYRSLITSLKRSRKRARVEAQPGGSYVTPFK